MGLHDVDKDNFERSAPAPNHSDVVSEGAVKAHQTLSTTYKTKADSNQALKMVFKNNLLVTYDAAGNISSVYGYVTGVGTTPVFIIANSGKDVFTDILGIAKPSGL